MLGSSLPELLDSAAAVDPRAPAFRAPGLELTRAELRSAVDALATRLAGQGVRAGDHVGLCARRGPWPFLASAAILRLGAAYVPMDPSHPAERLSWVASDSGISAAVADRPGNIALAEAGIDSTPLGHEWLSPVMQGGTSGQLPPFPPGESVAYVMYTSGSTGQPKGVAVQHSSVLAMLAGMLPFVTGETDGIWPQVHAHTFDVSVWEMWGSLAAGACLVTLTDDIVKDPLSLAEALVSNKVTTLSIVPSIFRHLTETVLEERLHVSLRRVIFAGERLDRRVAAGWRRSPAGSDTRMLNVYGVTEAAVYNTVRELTDDDLDCEATTTPIGRALPDSPIVIVGADRNLVPPGTAGELAIGGAQVARGYLNRPQLSARSFRELPGLTGRWYLTGDACVAAGEDIQYIGRLDDQVKVQGVRIELGEIEHALRQLAWVRDAAVLVAATSRGEAQLCAVLVVDRTVEEKTDWRSTVRRELSRSLPEVMLPQRVSVIERIPQNTSGKVDRHRLAQSFA